MKKFVLIGVMSAAFASTQAQDVASSPASSPDMNELREQVKALTETVKTLQQQVKDQQTTINKLNQQSGGAPENEEAAAVASTSPSPAGSPSPSVAAKGSFPTEDASVVSSTSTTTS